jgi:hypothetical protein
MNQYTRDNARADTVVVLLAQGLTRSQIGDQLHISRGAVSGIVDRLSRRGVLPRPKKIKAKTRTARPPPKPRKPRKPTRPTRAPASLLAIGDNHCTWPMSGAGSGMLYCGEERAGHPSYCSYHVGRAYKIPPAGSTTPSSSWRR